MKMSKNFAALMIGISCEQLRASEATLCISNVWICCVDIITLSNSSKLHQRLTDEKQQILEICFWNACDNSPTTEKRTWSTSPDSVWRRSSLTRNLAFTLMMSVEYILLHRKI
jgi:hypothetical protein